MTELMMNAERSGAERLKARERRRWMIGLAALVVLALDAIFLWRQGGASFDLGDMSPDLANGIATGILVGCLVFIPLARRMKHCDEHELRARRLASQAGFFTFLIALPVWALFAAGNTLPPVNAIAVCLAALAVYLAVFAWNKYR
ncbi:hypothetical protein [Stakelama marina]|uniref:Uncharacterized protein n=1 Tax=Stakelama marina TaxID=2826939 RepID=A0A8T4IJM7_9SPHN|nr:hypothetical protein [Stakelama marina]MBR0552376.1 hypothetical protein [Stakelama marina]